MDNNPQKISLDSYVDCIDYHLKYMVDIPLRVFDTWPVGYTQYYYNHGYSPKQCACAILVNDFGLSRLMLSHRRIIRETGKPEVNCDWTSLLIAANLPFVNPVSDLDEFIGNKA